MLKFKLLLVLSTNGFFKDKNGRIKILWEGLLDDKNRDECLKNVYSKIKTPL